MNKWSTWSASKLRAPAVRSVSITRMQAPDDKLQRWPRLLDIALLAEAEK